MTLTFRKPVIVARYSSVECGILSGRRSDTAAECPAGGPGREAAVAVAVPPRQGRGGEGRERSGSEHTAMCHDRAHVGRRLAPCQRRPAAVGSV